MALLDDILAKLTAMSPAEYKRVQQDVMAATGHMCWIPNPGPQSMAFLSPADELFYGGSAGGGKSALGLGLALTNHTDSLILRRFNKDARQLADDVADIIKTTEGRNSQLQQWRYKGRTLDFGGCPNEDDKQRFKGLPHDLICVERGTLVEMADGSTKAIEDLRLGDEVLTMEGGKRVTRLYPLRRDKAVRVTVYDDAGEVIAQQVQSRTHSLLTSAGWVGHDNADGCSPPWSSSASQSRSSHRFSSGSEDRSSAPSPHRVETHACRQPADGLQLSASGLQGQKETSAYDPRSDGGSGCGSSDGWSEESQPPALSSVPPGHQEPYPRSVEPASPLPSGEHDGFGVPGGSLPQDCSDRYSSGIRPCGELPQLWIHRHSELEGDQLCPPQLIGAGQPIPIGSEDGGRDRTPKHIHHKPAYIHPYTKEIRQIQVGLRLYNFSYELLDEVDLFDIQVDEVNHYITKGGFVNKNCFDEIPDFLKSQFTFIKIWNRTTKPGQRCRVVCTGNPPTTPEGLWVIEYWAAWLDPRHPNPAKEGELRWYVTTKHGEDREVDGPGPHRLEYEDGSFEEIRAKSRTFIRARLADNPFLMKTDYAANLDAMPAELRAAYRDGRFDLALEDNPRQVIPTSWVIAAQERWRKHPHPPDAIPMCAMGIDPAAGGKDETVLAPRYDGWFAPLIAIPGAKTPLGSDVAAVAIAKRKDQALLVVDMGGGYGGGVAQTLGENDIEYVAHKGAETATGRTRDGKLGFVNKRSQIYWRFREALDPDQTGGSPIMLPDDARLMADLTAPTFSVGPRGITVEPKEDVVERLGRSPDRGDAVVMSWSGGATMASHGSQWRQGNVVGMAGAGRRNRPNLQTVAKMGYDSRRRR